MRCLRLGLIGLQMVMAGWLLAEDKIYLKGSDTPSSGTISKVDDAAVYLELASGGATTLQRANIERVEIVKPAALEIGLRAFRDGKAEEGFTVLEPIYMKYRGLPDPWLEEFSLQLGDFYLAASDWNKAKSLFIEFQKFYPQSIWCNLAINGQARALLGLKQVDAALKLLEGLADKYQKDIDISDEENRIGGKAFVTLGHCYLAAQKNEQALEAFLKATVLYYLDPDAVAEARYQSALLFEKMNNISRAQGQLEELLKEHPHSAFANEAKKKLNSLTSH